MRRILGLLLLIIPFCAFAVSLVTPASLHKGDKVAIISPASVPNKEYIEAAVKVLTDWGYTPVKGKYVGSVSGTFAGTQKQRLHDIKWAFEDKDIKAILCTRGGYGSIQSLCDLPGGYFAQHPKWIIGYSDITAIHSAIACDSVKSIHAHMCEYLRDTKGRDSLSSLLKKILVGDTLSYTIKSKCKYNKEGKANGILFGGNLTMLQSVASTRIDFLQKNEGKGVILFVEDVGERMESVDRMFYRLKMAGILDNISGLIVGSFRNCNPTVDYKSLSEFVNTIVKDKKIPVVYNFPVGHVDNNYPMIQGANVSFEVFNDTCILKFE